MNLEEMQSIWRSPGNQPPLAAHQMLVDQFARQIKRRRRFQCAWLVNSFVWLTLVSGLAAWNVVEGKFSIRQEWALIPLLLLPWAFAIHFLRRYLTPTAPIARGEMSVIDALKAAIGSQQAEESQLKRLAALWVILIPVVSVCVSQLKATGKVSGRELTSMTVFMGAVLLMSVAGVAIRYFGRVLPQLRQLNVVLAELQRP